MPCGKFEQILVVRQQVELLSARHVWCQFQFTGYLQDDLLN